jgi:hypothetical protein
MHEDIFMYVAHSGEEDKFKQRFFMFSSSSFFLLFIGSWPNAVRRVVAPTTQCPRNRACRDNIEKAFNFLFAWLILVVPEVI